MEREIIKAKKRFDLKDSVQIKSCYEAGPDGFWLHRYLLSKGIDNLVVDSSSITEKYLPGADYRKGLTREPT